MTEVFNEAAIQKSASYRANWEQTELAGFLELQPESAPTYLSDSRLVLRRTYTPADVAGLEWESIGLPGAEPFTLYAAAADTTTSESAARPSHAAARALRETRSLHNSRTRASHGGASSASPSVATNESWNDGS